MTAVLGVKDIFIVQISCLESEEVVADIGAVAGALFFRGMGIDADPDFRFDQKAPFPETATRTVLIRMMMSIHRDQFLM